MYSMHHHFRPSFSSCPHQHMHSNQLNLLFAIGPKNTEMYEFNPESQNQSQLPAYNSKSNQQKQQKLNAQLLRIKSQHMQKYIEPVWQMNEEELYDFFTHYQSLCQIVDVNQLIASQSKMVRLENKIYLGQTKSKKKHGVGITLYQEGRIYQGRYVDNQKSGFGCEIYSNGNMYIGQFHQNKKHGKGTFFWFSLCDNSATKNSHQKVQQYEGTWWGGLPDGEGQHEKANGDFYLGHFKNGLKHGEGVQYYQNGDKYKGQFVNGLPQGYGEYTWADGTLYRGDFKQGYRNGYGVWTDNPPSEQNYKGHYMLDKKHGYGIYDWGNGYLYKGSFFEDQRCGEGQLFYNNELVYEGFWINGQRCNEDEYHTTQNAMKDNNSKVSTNPAQIAIQRTFKNTKVKKSADKQKKEQGSFIINFKHVQPEQKTCKRGCPACKSKQKKKLKSKSKQRKIYVIPKGKH